MRKKDRENKTRIGVKTLVTETELECAQLFSGSNKLQILHYHYIQQQNKCEKQSRLAADTAGLL